MTNMYNFSNNVTVVNCTPHSITFEDAGNLINVPSDPAYIVNARVEETVHVINGVEFATPKFVPCQEGYNIINRIHNECGKEVIIIGSILAAQSYPGLVYGMTPVPGYERVAPSEKRMRCDKFTVYPA